MIERYFGGTVPAESVGAGPEAARLPFGELRETLWEALEAVARLPDRQRQ